MPPAPDPASRPRPLRAMPAGLCRELAWFFTDIDDTLTKDGMLPDSSYASLWELSRAGVRVVPVTGRPAGWCDHIARMWPVAGVVGENGAFTYVYDRGARRMRRVSLGGSPPEAARSRLQAVAAKVLREVPGTALAADQPFRVSDMAIDFREDVPPLGREGIDAICTILQAEGVRWKVSSIHVNFLIGDFDKLSGVERLLVDESGSGLAAHGANAVFIGDSPNDEPLFAGFPHSIAVGNIRAFLDRVTARPEYITDADAADGFVEAVRFILTHRTSAQ